MLNRYFKLEERGTSVRTEVLAGITTFMTMAYILAVNPSILSACGMDSMAVFAATAISAAISTLIMGLTANLPLSLAPGMGLNAFFAFSVVLGMGHTWQFALTAVFLEGIIFIFLTITNMREAILNCIPPDMKKAISAGIGLFIAFIGLQSSGIVVKDKDTLVALGSMLSPDVMVAFFGILFTGVLLSYRVRGALLLGILGSTLLGIPLGVTGIANFSGEHLFAMPNLQPTFWQFEWHNIFTLEMLIILWTFLFVDLFDTVGNLIGLGAKANLLDKDGRLPHAKNAFLADAIGTTLGAILGTSTVTTYVESASGIAEGGRTGLTALTVAGLFTASLFLAPIFLLIPKAATAATLIIVGLFMLSPIVHINFDDYVGALPAFLTMLLMPLTYSVATGIVWGIISHVVLSVLAGRGKEVHVLTYALFAVFICRYALG